MKITNLATHTKGHVTLAELAEYLSVSVSTLYRYMKLGRLLGVRVGGTGAWRIQKEEALRFMATGIPEAPPPLALAAEAPTTIPVTAATAEGSKISSQVPPSTPPAA